MSSFIYFDHNATTPVDNRVLEAMLPYFTQNYGNAASITYSMGLNAKNAVEAARIQVASLINCIAQEITFTSGATEAINTAIKGVFWRYKIKGNHFVASRTEHNAVIDALQWIESQGAEVSYLDVDENGLINIEQLNQQIKENTVAVVIMLANNETGVIQPIRKIAKVVHDKKSILICDATQAIGKIQVDVQELGIDILVLSAHKFYGPKGVGALYLRRKNPRVSIEPLIHGGGHERGNRSGTLNVPGIVGLGKAALLATEYIKMYQEKITPIKEHIENQLIKKDIAKINAHQVNRLPNTINAQLLHLKAETVIKKIQNKIGISTGSACSSSRPEPSHVLLAMGLSPQQSHHTIRISLGIENTMEDAEVFLKLIEEITVF
ncbi:MAG: cysteine desulfurase [Chitinophagales bacterium]|nr:cysteine desulfurase [Chitinophagales bacterium]